jgi:zinc transport system substrate-binding protein
MKQAWMPRLAELNKEMKTVILSNHIELIAGACEHDHHGQGHDHGVDPHIWMSPKVVLQLLPHIKTAFLASFPELKSTIEENYDDLFLKISQADEHMTTVTRQLPKKEFLIFHPALSYLARDYGLCRRR